MARMPGATWRPVDNRTVNGQLAVYGVLLHIMEGTLPGTDSWFHNSDSEASAHFGIGRDGTIYQWVDTKDRAWHAAGANSSWLGIEHEGKSGEKLTDKQLAASARVIAWMHQTHGVKLQAVDSPTGRGIGWHGMGGSAWGGHPNCPGKPIRDQRAAIIKAAGGAMVKPVTYEPFPGSGWFKKSPHSPIVTAMGRRLVEEGYRSYSVGPGPQWTDGDRTAYAWWQRKLGYRGSDADGWPGKTSWDKLHVPNV